MSDGQLTLRYWRGDFYSWRGSHWKQHHEDDLVAHLYEVLANASYQGAAATPTELPWRPNAPKVGHVMHALQSRVLRPTEADADDSSGQGIAFANGVLDLSTRVLKPHSPSWFNLSALPYDYDPDAPEPVEWLTFLDSLWGDGLEIDLLQEWIGYLVSGRIDMHKMAVLVGPTRAGKSVIGMVCNRLLGMHNSVGISVNDFGSGFGMAGMVGRSLAVIGDARFTSRNSGDAVENLLRVIGTDHVSINRKYKDAWEGVLPTRIMALTNEMPAVSESSSALAKRMLIFKFTKTFVGREDRGLLPRLSAELPSILQWALVGYDRLVENSLLWTEPPASVAAQREVEELNSPVMAFMNAACRRVEGSFVTKPDLYNAYRAWCDGEGRTYVLPSQHFFRNLSAAYGDLVEMRIDTGRRRERCVMDVELDPDFGSTTL